MVICVKALWDIHEHPPLKHKKTPSNSRSLYLYLFTIGQRERRASGPHVYKPINYIFTPIYPPRLSIKYGFTYWHPITVPTNISSIFYYLPAGWAKLSSNKCSASFFLDTRFTSIWMRYFQGRVLEGYRFCDGEI